MSKLGKTHFVHQSLLMVLIGLIVLISGSQLQAMLAATENGQYVHRDADQVMQEIRSYRSIGDDSSLANDFESSAGPGIGSWGALFVVAFFLATILYFANFALRSLFEKIEHFLQTTKAWRWPLTKRCATATNQMLEKVVE